VIKLVLHLRQKGGVETREVAIVNPEGRTDILSVIC